MEHVLVNTAKKNGTDGEGLVWGHPSHLKLHGKKDIQVQTVHLASGLLTARFQSPGRGSGTECQTLVRGTGQGFPPSTVLAMERFRWWTRWMLRLRPRRGRSMSVSSSLPRQAQPRPWGPAKVQRMAPETGPGI